MKLPQLDTIYLGDNLALMRTWPDRFVQTCVTSPPYYQLRDYGVAGQVGLEESPEAFVAKLVEVFREVRRIMRDDGTLWLNLGDSYNAYNGNRGTASEYAGDRSQMEPSFPTGHGLSAKGLKPKDLIGIPWMVAFALRADGWYLRSDIIWAKKNCMPESVTDRPTKAHEYFFLLSKSEDYFYDHEAIKEKAVSFDTDPRAGLGNIRYEDGKRSGEDGKGQSAFVTVSAMRNKRSVWHVGTKPFAEAHFATFPTDLITPCVLAGTSEKGACAECGAPIVRETERIETGHDGSKYGERAVEATGGAMTGGTAKSTLGSANGKGTASSLTTGWQRSCKCSRGGGTRPCVVLDPFMGAGTTALVAATYGRSFIGCELNADYKAIADKRVANEVAQEKLL